MNETEQHIRVLAIDIGGTKIAAALVDGVGGVLSRGRVATPDTDDPTTLVGVVAGLAEQLLSTAGAAISDVSAVGISCAGIIDTREGVVVFSPNIPSLRRTPLRSMLSDALGCRCSSGTMRHSRHLASGSSGSIGPWLTWSTSR